CCFPMDQCIEHSHGPNADDGFGTGARLDLGHAKSFESGWSSIDVAGPEQVGHIVSRGDRRYKFYVFFDPQLFGNSEIDPILKIGPLLRPYFAYILPVRHLVSDLGKSMHDFLGSLRSAIPANS